MNAQVKSTRAQDRNQTRLEDVLVAQAEALIVRGKEQGSLTPDEILEGFPDLMAEPDDLFRIFRAFEEMGIPVSDSEREADEGEDGDQGFVLFSSVSGKPGRLKDRTVTDAGHERKARLEAQGVLVHAVGA